MFGVARWTINADSGSPLTKTAPGGRTCPCCRVLHTPSRFFQYLVLLWLLTSCVSANFYRDFPPMQFHQNPLPGSVKAIGSLKLLQCYANGDPPPEYSWIKDNVYVPPKNRTETTMKITNIQRSDAGYYQCEAVNQHGALLSEKAHIDVAYMVPFAYTGNQDKFVDQGQVRTIDLPPIDSFPPPSITWFEWVNGNWRRIPTEGQRYHMTLRKQLVILETRLSSDNNKMFRARALLSQTGEESDSQTFVLKVQNVGSLSNDIPPEIIIPPSHTTAVEGDDHAVLECVANARPLNYLSLKWYRRQPNGQRQVVDHTNVKYLFTIYRRRLTILNPRSDDSGTYLCEAQFSRPGGPDLPTALAEANLTVQVKPSFINPPPSEMSDDVGTTVEVPCGAGGVPTPSIRWYRNAKLLDIDADIRFSVKPNGNLEVTDTQSADSGVYQCFITNPAGEMNRATWLKILSFAPEITVPPHNLSVIEGEIARFPCEVNGAPRPSVRWYRELLSGSTESLPGRNARIQVLAKELLIPSTEVSDTGRYVCEGTNSLGKADVAALLAVTRRTRIFAAPQDASVIMGSTTTLRCGVSHDTSVTVTWHWYHKRIPIPGDDRRTIERDGSLRIQAVRNTDIGMYKCEVTSLGGNDTAQANITVIQIPYSPAVTEVHLNTESKRSVDISWQPGFDGNSPILRFQVYKRMVPPTIHLLPSEGWEVVERDVPADSRSHTVTGLIPARHYEFRVSAVNAVGEGQPSAASQKIEMPQQPPSGPPRSVAARPRSNSSIMVQWQPPAEDEWNGPLQGYRIRYMLSRYPENALFKNISNHIIMNDELTGLIVFEEYEVAVAAYNQKGVGVYSDYVRERTMEGRPIAAPSGLKAAPENSTTIKLTWMPPDPQLINGINQGYKVHAHQTQVNDSRVTVTVPSNTANMLGKQTGYLLKLRKYTDYTITVLCFTASGDGPTTAPVRAMTLEDVPDQVSSLKFDRILDTSLRVLWTPPENINGQLIGYTLTYMRKNETISKQTMEKGPDTLNYTITGLTATTVYTIQVYAKTSIGAGPPRTHTISSGVPPVIPEPPRSLGITNIQARSVLLQFVPGFSGHTSISQWIVQGQTTAEAAWLEVYREAKPDAESLIVTGLRPYSRYRLRMIAENIKGPSNHSSATRWFETFQAAPERSPSDVNVRAVNETALRVRWTPLTEDTWNGEKRGYVVQYKTEVEAGYASEVIVNDEAASSCVVGKLQEWTVYLIRVAAVNAVGNSKYSNPAQDRTRESVPSAGPANVTAEAISPTSIQLHWDPVPLSHQNGLVLGYKVQYHEVGAGASEIQVLVVNTTASRQAMLTGLRKFVEYLVEVLAYTRIGDGKPSGPSQPIRTHESTPGAPCCVYFPEVTPTTARIEWGPPQEPNGRLTGYRVSYRRETEQPSYAKITDDLAPDTEELFVKNLERNTLYMFEVTARTTDWGVPLVVNVYTVTNRRVTDEPTLVRRSSVAARWVEVSWQAPINDGYGPIRNYTIQKQEEDAEFNLTPNYIAADQTAHTVEGLRPSTKYRFRVGANNDIGRSAWSVASEWISTDQAAPDSPPQDLKVIPKTQTSVLVTWKKPPKPSWNGHLQGYELNYREVLGHGNLTWQPVDITYPDLDYHTVAGLQLFKTYEFRMRTYNMRGFSPWSQVVMVFLEIDKSWNGEKHGYQVWCTLTDFSTTTPAGYHEAVSSEDQHKVVKVLIPQTEYMLTGLLKDATYEIKVVTYNSRGLGPFSVPLDVRVGEAVPTASPHSVQAITKSSTEITILWKPPPEDARNGELLGYKLFYWVTGEQATLTHTRTVGASDFSATLGGLHMYTEYAVILLAFNAAGLGPNTTIPAVNTTAEGVPGRPGELHFVVTTLTSLNVSWNPPAHPNGNIRAYEISYFQDSPVDGESRSVQVKLPGSRTHYPAIALQQDVKYVFSVRSRTQPEWWGPHSVGNVTIAPQPGSPDRPSTPSLITHPTSLTLMWVVGNHGDSNITSYIVESHQKELTTWKTELNKNGGEPQANVSYHNLLAHAFYRFRITAINARGISYPSEPSEFVQIPVLRLSLEAAANPPAPTTSDPTLTPGVADVNAKPFYQQWWFQVIIALIGLIIIIIVISLLCLTGRNRRNKTKAGKSTVQVPPFPSEEPTTLPRQTMQLSPHGTLVGAVGGPPTEEDGFSTYQMRRSQRSSQRPHRPPRNGSLPPYSRSVRSPPRPSPSSVNYSDDEYKGYADDDNSDVSEKPSEFSSEGSQASDSEPESEKGAAPPPFPNYVNGDVRQSWKRQGPYTGNQQPQPAYPSYPESDRSDSQYGVALNGGHVIMNNRAGSRAPLPGFSSFV